MTEPRHRSENLTGSGLSRPSIANDLAPVSSGAERLFGNSILGETPPVDRPHSASRTRAPGQRRVALYVRVSTDGQTVENQCRELEAVAERHGWQVVHLFADEGISGAKGRDKRPGFDALCRGIARREFDIAAAWSVDRLGRSLQDLVGFLAELHAKGCDLYLHQQGLDTSTPAGRAMFQMLGVFAEFERAMIQDRVKAGLARARAQGKRLGRPPVGADVEHAVTTARQERKSIRAIARELGIGVGTVQRIIAPGSSMEEF